MFEVFVQFLGYVAIACNLISVQFNKYGKIILFKTLGSLLFALQYFLLGAYTGMVMDLIGSARNIIFGLNVKNKRSNKPFVIIFSALTLVLGVLTIVMTWDVSKIIWTSDVQIATTLMVIVSIISIVAKLLTTVAYSFNNPHLIRMINLPSCSCWIVYNLVVFSTAGVVNEIMSISSIVIAELRFRKPNKRKIKMHAAINNDSPSQEKSQTEN